MLPLYPSDSPQLTKERVREPEYYNMSKAVPGRITWITNIHNPSIEVHTVESGINTGAAIILAAGGGHRTLNVGSESADFVPFFYSYGVNTIILRNRLRADGYSGAFSFARIASKKAAAGSATSTAAGSGGSWHSGGTSSRKRERRRPTI